MNVSVRIQTGAKVRIRGKEYEAGPILSGGRVFFDKGAGTQLLLSEIAQLKMARDWTLTSGELPAGVHARVAQALTIDWGSFTAAEREIAFKKAEYVRRLDELPPRLRVKKKCIIDVIEQLGGVPAEQRPSARSVRRWYRLFVAAGRDIRALVDFDYAKGNRLERYPAWVIEEAEAVIDEYLLSPTPSSFLAAWRETNSRIKERLPEESESLDQIRRGKKDIVGQNLIARLFKNREQYEVLTAQVGQREADRVLSSVQLGPQGQEVNFEWEVDHTLLDVIVIDPDTGKAGARPWMTTILDRYTRCIVGFSLSFAPPSWASIMDALRIAVRNKERIIAALGGIKNSWECFGTPKFLITDKGRDFMSESLDQTASALGFKLIHMKPKKPWLKGKIERWFRTMEDEVVHMLPGTTFSNVTKRKFYDSEGCAVLTIEEINWIIAKWIIDVYHQKTHRKLKISPAKMWERGLQFIETPCELPASLLKPLMGLVVSKLLRRTGVTFEGLRWDSHAFSGLRNRLPRGTEVLVRIDPMDLKKAYAWDEQNEDWAEGELQEPTEARPFTLDQWRFIREQRRRNLGDGMEENAALAAAISEIKSYVAEVERRRGKSKAPRRLLEFKSEGRSAWDKILPDRWDEGDSAGPPMPHHIGLTPIESPPIAESGPFEDAGRPKASKRTQFSEPVGAAGKEARSEPQVETGAAVPPVETKVRRRKSDTPTPPKAPQDEEEDTSYTVRTRTS